MINTRYKSLTCCYYYIHNSDTYLRHGETKKRLSELPSPSDKPEAAACYWCVDIPTRIPKIPASFRRLSGALIGQCRSATRVSALVQVGEKRCAGELDLNDVRFIVKSTIVNISICFYFIAI